MLEWETKCREQENILASVDPGRDARGGEGGGAGGVPEEELKRLRRVSEVARSNEVRERERVCVCV